MAYIGLKTVRDAYIDNLAGNGRISKAVALAKRDQDEPIFSGYSVHPESEPDINESNDALNDIHLDLAALNNEIIHSASSYISLLESAMNRIDRVNTKVLIEEERIKDLNAICGNYNEFKSVVTLKASDLAGSFLAYDDRTFCCSVGSHEAWATPGGLESYSIEFEQPEQLANYSPIGNLLPRRPVILGENVCELPLKTEYFAIDALVFPHLKSRAVTLKKQDKEELRVSYEGMDVLLLWTKPGANYICIEPWCSAPDYVDSDMQIRNKPGILTLAPGKETERTHLIEFF